MAVKIIDKKAMQQLLQDFRRGGYEVVKEYGMYKVKLDGDTVLTALNGSRGYLTRYTDGLITEGKE